MSRGGAISRAGEKSGADSEVGACDGAPLSSDDAFSGLCSPPNVSPGSRRRRRPPRRERRPVRSPRSPSGRTACSACCPSTGPAGISLRGG
jgi:hypothetical protein